MVNIELLNTVNYEVIKKEYCSYCYNQPYIDIILDAQQQTIKGLHRMTLDAHKTYHSKLNIVINTLYK